MATAGCRRSRSWGRRRWWCRRWQGRRQLQSAALRRRRSSGSAPHVPCAPAPPGHSPRDSPGARSIRLRQPGGLHDIADPARPRPWVAFVLASGFFLLADRAIDTVNARFGRSDEDTVVGDLFGVSMDLLTDSIMIGTGLADRLVPRLRPRLRSGPGRHPRRLRRHRHLARPRLHRTTERPMPQQRQAKEGFELLEVPIGGTPVTAIPSLHNSRRVDPAARRSLNAVCARGRTATAPRSRRRAQAWRPAARR